LLDVRNGFEGLPAQYTTRENLFVGQPRKFLVIKATRIRCLCQSQQTYPGGSHFFDGGPFFNSQTSLKSIIKSGTLLCMLKALAYGLAVQQDQKTAYLSRKLAE
jgi:hypothetical protein